MMKKITLLLLGVLFSASFSWSQVLLNETLQSGVPASWNNLDEDQLPLDPFFQGQGIGVSGSAWELVNFGPPFGVALYAFGEFATAPNTASDWLITQQVTIGSEATLTFDHVAFAAGTSLEVRVTSSIAGTVPAPSDFTDAPIVTLSPAGGDLQVSLSASVDLHPTYSGQNIYVAFVNTTVDPAAGNQIKIVGIKNVKITEPVDFLLTIDDVNIVNSKKETELFPALLDFFIADFSNRDNLELNVDILNSGTQPTDTIFYSLGVFSTADFQGFRILDTIVLSTPLAAGDVHTHNIDTLSELLDLLFPGEESLYVEVMLQASNYNVTADTVDHFLFSVSTPFTAPFSSSFEAVAGNSLTFERETYSWKSFDLNNDGNTFNISTYTNLQGYQSDWYVDGSPAVTNDYLQSPEFTLETGKTYEASIWARYINLPGFTAGSVAFRIRNPDNSVSNIGGVVLTASDSIDYRKFTFNFTVATNSDEYKFEFFKSTAGFIALDLFEVIELVPPTVSLSLVNSSLTPGNGVEYCDSTITVNYVVSGPPTSLTIYWGNGDSTVINNPNPSGSATYSYSGLGTFSITASVANAQGTGTTATPLSVEIAPLPAANANFIVTSTNPNTGVVTIQNNSTPNCPGVQYFWNFGDGTILSGNQTTHTYTANGPFTIVLTMNVFGNVDYDSIQVGPFNVEGGVSINEIDFTSAMSVYPNPSRDMVNVAFELSKMQNVELSIVSIDGKVVATQNMSNALNVNTSFNVSKLNSGVYLMKVKTDDGLATQRFVVSHN